MIHAEFEYKDKYTKGDNWSHTAGTGESLEQIKKFFGFGTDPSCEYRITKIEEV